MKSEVRDQRPEEQPQARKFRKKPVVIEAMLFDGSMECADAIEAWSKGFTSATLGRDGKSFELRINTREGTMEAKEGDYIIKGVKGEFYPCKPDIFAATYDEVEARETF